MDNHDHDLLVRIDANVLALVESRADHEVRIRSLESTKQNQKGAIAVITAVMSAAWAAIVFAVEAWRNH